MRPSRWTQPSKEVLLEESLTADGSVRRHPAAARRRSAFRPPQLKRSPMAL